MVDKLPTSTAGGFTVVDIEIISIRSIVMRNRLALDILLAKEAGVFRLVKGKQCCIYIPAKSRNLKSYIKNITDLSKDLKRLKSDGSWEMI